MLQILSDPLTTDYNIKKKNYRNNNVGVNLLFLLSTCEH